MELLEMPLDAPVFRLYSLPTTSTSSFWACVAVLTAAVGLWGIRAVGYKTDATTSASPPSSPSKLTVEAQKVLEPSPEEVHRQFANHIVVRSSSCHVEEVNTPKARFTAYYHAPESFGLDDDDAEDEEMKWVEEEVAAQDEEEMVVDSVYGIGVRMTAAPWMVVSRRWDLGWYRYQDLAALNGSVVRLWDGSDRRLAAMTRSPAGSPRSI